MKKALIAAAILCASATCAAAQCPNIITPTCAPTCTDIENALQMQGSCSFYAVVSMTWNCQSNTGTASYLSNSAPLVQTVSVGLTRFNQAVILSPIPIPCRIQGGRKK